MAFFMRIWSYYLWPHCTEEPIRISKRAISTKGIKLHKRNLHTETLSERKKKIHRKPCVLHSNRKQNCFCPHFNELAHHAELQLECSLTTASLIWRCVRHRITWINGEEHFQGLNKVYKSQPLTRKIIYVHWIFTPAKFTHIVQ